MCGKYNNHSRFNFVKAETFEIRAFPIHLIGISWFLTTLGKSLYTLPAKIKKKSLSMGIVRPADSQNRNLKKCMLDSMENIDFDLNQYCYLF